MPTAHLPGDLQMYYEDDDFTDPWLETETVILHHGNAKNSRLWYAWVPWLARDYRVIRLDARGFGRSSIPAPGYNWSLEGFATDLVHLMDHLGIDKAHVVGDTSGVIKMIADRSSSRLLGVHLVCHRGADMINEAALALQMRATIDDLATTMHVYPSIGEGLRLCAQGFSRDISRLSCCAE